MRSSIINPRDSLALTLKWRCWNSSTKRTKKLGNLRMASSKWANKYWTDKDKWNKYIYAKFIGNAISVQMDFFTILKFQASNTLSKTNTQTNLSLPFNLRLNSVETPQQNDLQMKRIKAQHTHRKQCDEICLLLLFTFSSVFVSPSVLCKSSEFLFESKYECVHRIPSLTAETKECHWNSSDRKLLLQLYQFTMHSSFSCGIVYYLPNLIFN